MTQSNTHSKDTPITQEIAVLCQEPGTKTKYISPCVSIGSASVDPTYHESKIFKKMEFVLNIYRLLSLLQIILYKYNNYLHSVYMYTRQYN